ncbi:MAG: YhfC family intramembrane metalloprotease [Oscillospiraceae bacterium]|nr:YhfC family intramembrane metalloprotease [Oscillospiraceae bacterium]
MFSTSSIAALGVCGGLCIIIPLAAGIIFKIKNKDVPFSPFFIGAAVFIIFALILEQLLHSVMIPIVSGKPVLYIIYGALAAGFFEETGRFTAYKLVMKKSTDPRSAVLYGLGHGGCEAILIIGVTMISLCISLSMANSMGFEEFIAMSSGGSEETAGIVRAQMEQLVDFGFADGLLALFERLAAITFHTALSVIMFGVLRGKMRYYPICILIHTLGDVPSAMYQVGLMPLPLTYVFLCITVPLTVWFAVRVCRKMK